MKPEWILLVIGAIGTSEFGELVDRTSIGSPCSSSASA